MCPDRQRNVLLLASSTSSSSPPCQDEKTRLVRSLFNLGFCSLPLRSCGYYGRSDRNVGSEEGEEEEEETCRGSRSSQLTKMGRGVKASVVHGRDETRRAEEDDDSEGGSFPCQRRREDEPLPFSFSPPSFPPSPHPIVELDSTDSATHPTLWRDCRRLGCEWKLIYGVSVHVARRNNIYAMDAPPPSNHCRPYLV
ncbi:hypothetical protein BHE74_00010309 [Ensete ventricosum]|nr:hypothetical protein GW17_00047226 [Ensete ventricosum]RWW81310.1 hypothetical protein BHE74_00010309 [Ensete ventricosum]RZR88864.1 hypothetical protein BHM03_00016513 [Ensete ventricosum]